jgi:hypothetical protein
VATLEAVVSLNNQSNGVETMDATEISDTLSDEAITINSFAPGPETSSLLSHVTSGPNSVEMTDALQGEVRTIVLQSDEVLTNTGDIVRLVSTQDAVYNPRTPIRDDPRKRNGYRFPTKLNRSMY